MMREKKVILLSTFLFFLVFLSFGQQSDKEFKLQFSDSFLEKTEAKVREIVGHDDQFIFVAKRQIQTVKNVTSESYVNHLEKYDHQFKLLKTTEFSFQSGKEKRSIKDFVYVNNNLYVFTSYKNNKTKTLYAQKIDKNTLEVNEGLQKIVEIPLVRTEGAFQETFNIRLSNDESKILIYHDLTGKKDKVSKSVLYVLDSKLNILWFKNIEESFEINESYVIDNIIDNQGNSHSLYGFRENDNRKKKKDGKSIYFILSRYDNGNVIKKVKLDTDSKYFVGFNTRMAINNEGNLVFTGFYSDDFKNLHNIKGSFFWKINLENHTVINNAEVPFGLDFIGLSLGKAEKNKLKEGDELNDYFLKHIISKDDGGIILFGEQFSINLSTNWQTTFPDASQNTKTTIKFNPSHGYNDIIVINLSNEGDIIWKTKIPKRQTNTFHEKRYYFSFKPFYINNSLWVFYNDIITNKDVLIDDASNKLVAFTEEGSSTKYSTNLIRINDNGEWTKDVLFNTTDKKSMVLLPASSFKLSNNEIAFYAQNKKLFYFVKMVYN